MSDTLLLDNVKKGLLITGDYQDEALEIYIDDVVEFLISAGVNETVANSNVSLGVIVRGVSDLMSTGVLSSYFFHRLGQLVYTSEGENNVETEETV